MGLFDFLGYAETHTFITTGFVCLLILVLGVCVLLIRKYWHFHMQRMADLKAIAEARVEVNRLLHKLEKRLNELSLAIDLVCDGENCKNFQEAVNSFNDHIKAFYELREVILDFAKEGKESRQVTADAIARIEKTVTVYTDGLGAAVVKFMREGGRQNVRD